MSHYPVMVCLPGDTKDVSEALEQVLAPYDENISVEPYRRYENSSAEEYWWTKSMRTDLEGFRRIAVEGEDAVRAELLAKFRAEANTWDRDTPAEKTNKEIHDFRWAGERADRIAELPMTWATLVPLYNERWYPTTALALAGDDSDDDRLHFEEETGRAYTMSTYNPDSKWDYWRIGGRWSGYFVADESLEDIIKPERHWDGPNNSRYPGRSVCDGGRRRSLDFAAMRDYAEKDANERYDRWEQLVAEHGGDAKPWSHFTGLIGVVEDFNIDQARKLYHEQPIIAAHGRMERENNGIVGWGDCLIEEFLTTREEYVRKARAAVVPAYATVLLSGEWCAPGRMGWFGMSSDGPGEREGYYAEISKYLDTLSPDTWLVVVDCHI